MIMTDIFRRRSNTTCGAGVPPALIAAVLLYWAIMPADVPNCLAADPPAPKSSAAPAPQANAAAGIVVLTPAEPAPQASAAPATQANAAHASKAKAAPAAPAIAAGGTFVITAAAPQGNAVAAPPQAITIFVGVEPAPAPKGNAAPAPNANAAPAPQANVAAGILVLTPAAPAPAANAAPVVITITAAAAAPAPQKAKPEPAQPATKKGSQPAAKPGPKKASQQTAQKAAKKESLLGAIFDSFGGGGNANQGNMQIIEDQNIRNMEAQYRPQFQAALYEELAFLRRVCKPEAKPFAEIVKAANAELHVPLRNYVTLFYRPRGRDSGRNASNADPRSEIRNLLIPLAEAKLGPEKARTFRKECDQRAEAHKRAVVLNVVALLDERLVLTADQRAKLVKSLSTNYEYAWEQFFAMFAWGNQNYLPSIRDESIVPLLDERQKRGWEQSSKQNGQVFFGNAFQNPLGLEGEAKEIQEIAHIAEEAQNGH